MRPADFTAVLGNASGVAKISLFQAAYEASG
jgi:hypothetical protein